MKKVIQVNKINKFGNNLCYINYYSVGICFYILFFTLCALVCSIFRKR